MIGAFEQAMLTILVACMMLGMGAAMTPRDIADEMKRPKWLVLAVIGQFTFMPLIAFGLVQVFNIPPAIAIGLIIVGCMPGGTTSNLFTYFAKANLSLSVIVTMLTTMTAIIVSPLLITFYGGVVAEGVEIPYANIVVSLALLILPIFLGIWLRRRSANVGGSTEVIGSVFGILVILLLLVTWVPRNWTLLVDTFTDQPGVFAGAILLPVLGMAVAYLWAKVWGAQVADRRTYALEIGIVNGPLAVAVIALSFSGAAKAEADLIPALYSLFVVITASLVTMVFRRAFLRSEQKIPELL
ncbi:MAG: transporter [Actinobacteria bacterium]|nr:MAG: transporter [Actinomycetota bacterium]